MTEGPVEGTEGTKSDEQPLSPHVEKAYRRLSRNAAILTILFVVAALAGAAYIGSTAVGRRLQAARQLDRAIALLKGADETVLDIDEVVRAELSPQTATRALELLADVEDTRADLQEVARLVDGARGRVTDDERRRALLVRSAAVARLSMLEPAEPILAASVKAGNALGPATTGWDLVLAAEKLADTSLAEYNKLTKAAVTKSSSLASQSAEAFAKARPYFSQAATAFPEAGFDPYVRFVDAKLVLLDLSRQSNALWLKGDIKAANEVVKRYNAQEKLVSRIASEGVVPPGKAIAEKYEALASEPTSRYNKAREAATRADARLDDF